MKASGTVSDSTNGFAKRQSHVATFSKVLDGRKQPIRGLWERNGRYYAQITLENLISGEKKVKRVPLKDNDGKPVNRASQWLFPSPQRGEKDVPAKSFRESLKLVRERAEMPAFGFHDCRHHFISMCVMSGVDFMTIAAWVGHKDGGVLIGRVYGHLANEHRKAMAKRVNFELISVQEVVNA